MTIEDDLPRWFETVTRRIDDSRRSKQDRRQASNHRMFALAVALNEFTLAELNVDMLEALLAAAPLRLMGDAAELHDAGLAVWLRYREWSFGIQDDPLPQELALNKNLK